MDLKIPYDFPPLSRESIFLTKTVEVRLRDGSAKRAYFSHVMGVWLDEESYVWIHPEDVMAWQEIGGEE